MCFAIYCCCCYCCYFVVVVFFSPGSYFCLCPASIDQIFCNDTTTDFCCPLGKLAYPDTIRDLRIPFHRAARVPCFFLVLAMSNE